MWQSARLISGAGNECLLRAAAGRGELKMRLRDKPTAWGHDAISHLTAFYFCLLLLTPSVDHREWLLLLSGAASPNKEVFLCSDTVATFLGLKTVKQNLPIAGILKFDFKMNYHYY